MLVPETTVDEDDETISRQNKIGLTRQCRVMLSKADFRAAKDGFHDHLRTRATSTNLRHYRAALFWSERVHCLRLGLRWRGCGGRGCGCRTYDGVHKCFIEPGEQVRHQTQD